MATDSSPQRRIYTVTELTQAIKSLLETTYPIVWVTGEISNFSQPASGHFYFTLKDSRAQMSAVMFRGQNRALKFAVEDGMSVIGLGRLNIYEPRGVYQIILEYLEPKGVGELQLAFEQLKAKLAEEGLFSEEHKRPLPFLPKIISVVTSPTGAVIRDIINVVHRRFPGAKLQVVPARVQGDGALDDIVKALEIIYEKAEADVIIVARGGGSLEDLQPFNSEVVARAIFSSPIPVISAVGHETDFTIADFVADVRAPTPSAAAELVVPVKEELARGLESLGSSMHLAILQRLKLLHERAFHLSKRLVHPGRQISDYRLRLDDAFQRIVRGLSRQLASRQDHLSVMAGRLSRCSPKIRADELKKLLEHYEQTCLTKMQFVLQIKRSDLRAVVAKLNALNPLGILERGYSVTRVLPDYALVKDAQDVAVGDEVEVTLWRGSLACRVERKKDHGETDI